MHPPRTSFDTNSQASSHGGMHQCTSHMNTFIGCGIVIGLPKARTGLPDVISAIKPH